MGRFTDERKTIGLIIEDLAVDYAKEIIHSVQLAAAGYPNVRLIVLPGLHEHLERGKSSRYFETRVHNMIYGLEEVIRIDGLLLTLPNISGVSCSSFFNGEFSNYARIPRVFISTAVTDGVMVRYDNEKGIREAVDYLVNVKGLRKFVMLGGRDDNADAQDRKEVYRKCLAEKHIEFTEEMYEKTDMSIDAQPAAERLMERNPDAEAIFCVNDQVAVPLYRVLKELGMKPGRDIQVFGFDNTKFSGTMLPPLASIGADGITLGEKAVEMLLRMMDGEEVHSEVLPTRLYGKESLEYAMYEYTTMEMLKIDEAFVYRMFDDCFYRYLSEVHDREEVDLRRLFFEFITRMLRSMIAGSMSTEEFNEIRRLIDIFFSNGAMRYTDPAHMVRCIERLQNGMNKSQKSPLANMMTNRCFSYMKDRAIVSMAAEVNRFDANLKVERERIRDFFTCGTQFDGGNTVTEETIIRNLDKLSFHNAALYLFEKPVAVPQEGGITFPETARLMCVVKGGELRVLPAERRVCRLDSMLDRTELPKCGAYIASLVFYGSRIYGVLITEVTGTVADRGEFVAKQLAQILYINENNHKSEA
ncbi:MAG: substrate-binding domain-containing protein [Lachnospiraceae bacterium]|nr:substrate-binding domain-containing protein [Lachnospiraceae bacterium]